MTRDKGKRPYLQFFTSDWRSDPRLRMCGPAARGLWIELICLMHEAEPYGHLLVAGQHPTEMQLAGLTGIPSEQISDLLEELAAAGVFSRTRQGVIYSRRMVRDEKKRQIARKNGRNGGNPNLWATNQNPASDNLPNKGRDNTQSPESRVQIPEDDTAYAASSPTAAALDGQSGSFLDAVRKAARAPDSGAWLDNISLTVCVQRWQALGLSDEEILAVIRRTARGRRINSPEYFNAAMQEFAGQKAAPPLVPSAPSLTSRGGTAQRGSVIPIDGILKRYGSSQPKERKGDHD